MPVLIKSGALDERFSLWSAKPAKAVRLRHAPHKNSVESLDSTLIFFCIFYFNFLYFLASISSAKYLSNFCLSRVGDSMILRIAIRFFSFSEPGIHR